MGCACQFKSILYFSLFLFCVSCSTNNIDGFSYLIIEAKVVHEGAKQPTWIAFYDEDFGRLEHVEADKAIVKINSGWYQFMHIDFEDNIHEGIGTASSTIQNKNLYRFRPSVIYYMGSIHMKTSNIGYDLETLLDENLLQRACVSSPHLFQQLPVEYISVPNEKHYIEC